MASVVNPANKRTSNRKKTTDVKVKTTKTPEKNPDNRTLTPIAVENAGNYTLKWVYTEKLTAAQQGYLVNNSNSNLEFSVKNRNKKLGLNGPGTKIGSASDSQPVIPIQANPDKTYSWNLPPHKWSLPVDPSSVSNTVKAPSTDLHTNRRGIIFVGRKYNGTTTVTDAKTGKKENTGTGSYSSNYGFQFLWNPETFSQNTSVNWGITPDQNDKLSLLTGLVSSNSTIDFTLRIDRTNDFACAKANNILNTSYTDDIFTRIKTSSLNNFANYYLEGKAPNSDADFAANIDDKLKDLLTRGTEADLEFLYKTINGDGYNTSWGTSTSNISFLLPTVVRLDLGPQKLVGMVQSLNVTHLAFTREMIPIRTDVALSIDLRTAIGLTTSNFGASVDETKAATGTR